MEEENQEEKTPETKVGWKMSIISEDLGFIFLYILPGFLSFEICREIILLEREFKEFESVIYSFIFSTLIFTPAAYIMKITTIEGFKTSLYTIQNMFVFIIVGLILGYASGTTYKKYFLTGVYKGQPWDIAFNPPVEEAEETEYVYVLTTSGLEYQSDEVFYSDKEKPHELLLIDAKLVQRNDEFEITNIKELNYDVFIEGKYIERLLFQHFQNDN